MMGLFKMDGIKSEDPGIPETARSSPDMFGGADVIIEDLDLFGAVA